MNQCKKCGAENAKEAQFCNECGKPLNEFSNGKTIVYKRTLHKLRFYVKLPIILTSVSLILFFISIIVIYYYENEMKNITNTYNNEIKTIKGLDWIKKYDDLNNTFHYSLIIDIDSDSYGSEILQTYLKDNAQKFIDIRTNYEVAEHNKYHYESMSEGTIPSFVFSIVAIVVLYLIFNFGWKNFQMNEDYEYTKEKLKNYAFKENKLWENIRIKENNKGELFLKDKNKKKNGYFYLSKDKNGNTIILGEKKNTIDIIRNIFGKEINFIEN